MKKVISLNEKVLKVIEFLSAMLIASIALMILLIVISRAMNIGLQWPDEMSRFAYVALVFLGNIIATFRKKNITINMLVDALPKKIRKGFDIGIDLVVLLFGVLCVRGCAVLMTSASGVHSNSLVWFMMNYLYGFVLVCLILTCIESLLVLVIDVVPGRKEEIA